MSDNLRVVALEQATKVAASGGGNGDVLDLATRFLAFLLGTDAGASPLQGAQTATQTAAASGQQAGGDQGSLAQTSTADPAAAQQSAATTTQQADDPAMAALKPMLEQKCMELSGKKGAGALQAAFQSVGAAKWSEVPSGQYPALLARLTADLAS